MISEFVLDIDEAENQSEIEQGTKLMEWIKPTKKRLAEAEHRT